MSTEGGHTNRELVYCHSCGDEWYRDEHGLVCPHCHSDVVEIIEADHDPREEMQDEEVFDPAPGGNVFGTGIGGLHVPDPDEGDISVFDTPHGQMFRQSIHSSSNQPYNRPPPPPPPRPGNGGVQDLFTELFRSIGSMSPGEAMQHGQQRTPHSPRGEAPPVPNSTRPDASRASGSPPGMPQVQSRSYQWGPVQVNTTVTSYPTHGVGRGGPAAAGSGSMFAHDPDMSGMLEHMLGSMPASFANAGGQQQRPVMLNYRISGGNAAMARAPLQTIFASLGMMAPGARGFVTSDEELDRLISQLMENNQQSNAPGPAAEEAISNLPRVKVSKEMIGEDNTTAECGICLTECDIGEEVAELPCKHWYHFECIRHWLESHDSCPSCRRGIMANEGDESRPRATGEAPRNWQMPGLSRSNTNENQGEGESASRQQSSDSQQATPPRRERERSHRFSRSRSPAGLRSYPRPIPQPDRGGGGGSPGLSGSMVDTVRNGILGWVGRHLAVSQPGGSSTASDSPPATRTTSRRGEQESSRGHHSRRRDSRSTSELDRPEVD